MMDEIEFLLAVGILTLVVVALGWLMARAWGRTILLRGRRRREGLLARLKAAWRSGRAGRT